MREKYGINKIEIGFSCHKDWNSMEENNASRHCTSCNKEVYDFSTVSRQEIIDFLSKRKNENICGKFTREILTKVNAELATQSSFSFVRPILAASILTTAVSCTSTRQIDSTECDNPISFVEIVKSEINIDTSNINLYSGLVVDRDNIPIIGANIKADDDQLISITDLDGRFYFKKEKSIDHNSELTVQYTGHQDFTINLTDIRNKSVKIVLVDDGYLLWELVIHYPMRVRLWNKILSIFRFYR